MTDVQKRLAEINAREDNATRFDVTAWVIAALVPLIGASWVIAYGIFFLRW